MNRPFLASAVVALAFLLVSAGSLGAAPAPQQIKVAAVQMRSTRDLATNASAIAAQIKACATNGVRVVVFPECALTGYFEDVVTNLSAAQIGTALEPVSAACRQAAVYAIVGTAWREGTSLFDSALVIRPDGDVLARYDKIQLAESWPNAGENLMLFKVDGVPCSIIICHDERYPELVRLPVLAGARVTFYLSHESGLREERKIVPYRAQIQARAVENTVYIVQANAPANRDAGQTGSHGHSRIIAPDGNIMAEGSVYEEDVVVATLDLRKATADNARKSLSRGPLQNWWREGVRHVRIVE